MINFLDGASCLACGAIAVFFLRFWRLNGDRLLGLFGLAFVMLAINRVVLAAVDDAGESDALVYLPRAIAFALIVVAILDKNRTRRLDSSPD